MNDKEFTLENKKVIQEVIIFLGGEKGAECRSCLYWRRLCHCRQDAVCAGHSSVGGQQSADLEMRMSRQLSGP